MEWGENNHIGTMNNRWLHRVLDVLATLEKEIVQVSMYALRVRRICRQVYRRLGMLADGQANIGSTWCKCRQL